MTHETPTNSNFFPQRRGISQLGESQERRIRDFVEGIVRRARLWRSEQNEVRLELLDHFDDGIDAGRSIDQLLLDFGPPQVAAGLIRKAKLRNRPVSWYVCHRGLQVCTVSILLTLGCVAFLMLRLHLATSGPQTDYLGEMDRGTSSIAAADRAWPDYREGLIQLDRTAFKSTDKARRIDISNLGRPGDAKWKQTVAYLDANTKSIDLFVRASARPRLGYIYRDASNDPWLQKESTRTSAEMYPADVKMFETPLPQYQELGYVRQLLEAAARRAMEQKDLPGFERFWHAQDRLATQILEESEFFIVQGIGFVGAAEATALLRELVFNHPELVSDDELQQLRRDLEAAKWAPRSSTSQEFRKFIDELLQSSFSPEQDGGRLTVSGGLVLQRHFSYLSEGEPIKWAALLPEKFAVTEPHQVSGASSDFPNRVSHEITSIRWSATLANRLDMRREFDRLLALLEAEVSKPAASRTAFSQTVYFQELQKLAASPSQLRRYWPVLLLLPTEFQVCWPESIREEILVLREGTQASLALEQYRRRTGNWPDRLEQLVPVDLPRVPIDVYNGRPLSYRLVNGKPLLYSVWRDLDDDDGKPLPGQWQWENPPDGDFRLLPLD